MRPTGIYGLAIRPRSAAGTTLLVKCTWRAGASPKGGKEVHAADVARAVELLLNADAKAIAGQVFNCYDRYVAEQEVARIASELTGSPSAIADLNRGPKHQIETGKLRPMGMRFGGEGLLRRTVQELVDAHRPSRRRTLHRSAGAHPT